MSMNGAERIAAERKRQVEVEGWTPDHDDKHDDCALLNAALAYAARWQPSSELEDAAHAAAPNWRMGNGDAIDNLTKAGALIAAEIDRLLRVKV